MKPVKMLGLAALTALLAMAFVGASSAMAESTGLCSADESPCEAGKSILHVHETTLSGSKATLLNSISNVLCDALFLGDVEEEGNPEVIEGNFTYTNCVDEKPNSCTATEESASSIIKVLKEGHETAKVTGEGEVKVVCTGISCVYKGEGLIGTGKGPLLSTETNGEVSIVDQTTTKVKGLLCPATAKLDIKTTPLEATYLATSAAWKMACIKIGPNSGFYLGAAGTGKKCITKDATRVGEYELGWVKNRTLNTHQCAFVGANNGKWLTFTNEGLCANEDATFVGKFALGTVK
jgi:hypothetical protein